MFRFVGFTLAIVSGLSFAESPLGQVSPSFDCNKARSEVEKIICFGPSDELRLMDLFMSDLYRHALANSEDPERIRSTQREWLYFRDNYYHREDIGDEAGLECSFGRLHECYRYRIGQLWSSKVENHMYEKYKAILGWGDPPDDKVEAFLYERQARHAVRQVGQWCIGFKEEVVVYDQPVLVTEYSGSMTCGGTSHAFRLLKFYCETDDSFVEKQERTQNLPIWEVDREPLSVPQSELDSLCK